MKKSYLLVVLVVLMALLTIVGVVAAQSSTPPAPFGSGMGGRMGRGMMANAGQTALNTEVGPMHDAMVKVFASKLGLSVDEINSRLSKGETMVQIAQSKGLTTEQTQALMVEARNTALDQMVADKTITQEQADWMKSRSGQMMGAGGMGGGRMGAGGCGMNTTGTYTGMGGRGRWAGQQTPATPQP